jgi:nucleoid-associated protein YgaU
LPLELAETGFYRSEMKRISLFLAMGLLAAPAISQAQDAATEERLNKLSARIDVLLEAKDLQNKRIEELERAVNALQQQINKPSPNYASQEDLKNLADKIREVDQKRQDDNEQILKSVKVELRKLANAVPVAPVRPSATATPVPDKGYEYVIQSGDTISAIVSAYRDQGIKVTTEQIVNANPGLKPTSLRVGQKIFIPAPTQ